MSKGGTLYAIRAEGTSLVKIGYTKGPVEKRLKTLQTGQPFPLRVIATQQIDQNARQTEGWLHAFLKQERRRGEWFELNLEPEAFADLIARAIQFGAEQEAQRQLPASELDTFGTRLRRIRELRGWSQKELAARAGVDYMTVYRAERAINQEPRISAGAKLARALGVSLDVLADTYGDLRQEQEVTMNA